MKVAIVHDYIKEYGGAERVLEALHEIWPDAPVYTTVFLPEYLGPHKERFLGKLGRLGKLGNPPKGEVKWDIRTSFLQYLPFKAKLISPIRIIAPFVFSRFDFSEFDVVIVSATGAYTPNVISQRPKTKDQRPIYVCYCHTPPRYLYGFATARDWKKNIIMRIFGEIANHFLRMVDFKSAQNVDYFIANSHNIEARIQKFYRRESTVIYPPVTMINTDLKQIYTDKNPRKSYFVAGGRLARPKHIDLIVQACRKLDVPLKVFGKGFAGYQQELGIRNYELGNKKIEFVGEVMDEEKLELMRNAKAYIFAAEDEDFGITPVEAMSVGTPIIAYRSGGVQESVVDPSAGSGQAATGLFFDELSVKSLTSAMKQFNNVTINPSDCVNQAQKFSKERFKKETEEFVKGVFKKK